MSNLDAATTVRPSPGYLFTLAMGCVALPFMGIGLGGALIGRGGGDPMDATNVDGMAMFVLAFAVGFAMRLIFWPPIPARVRNLVRMLISTILLLNVPLSLLGLMLAYELPPSIHHFLPVWFSVLAVICQPLAILWLVRYRREGL